MRGSIAWVLLLVTGCSGAGAPTLGVAPAADDVTASDAGGDGAIVDRDAKPSSVPDAGADAPSCPTGRAYCCATSGVNAGVCGCFATSLCADPGPPAPSSSSTADPPPDPPPAEDAGAPDADPHAGERFVCCTGSTGPASAYCVFYENGIGNAGYSDTIGANDCKWEPWASSSALLNTNP